MQLHWVHPVFREQDRAVAADRIAELARERTRQREGRPAVPPALGIMDELFRDEGYGLIVTDAGERVGLNIEGGIEGPQATVVVSAAPDAPGPWAGRERG